MLLYAVPFWLLHGLANATVLVWKNGGIESSYDPALAWETMFRTGIYAYDFLMWVLALPFLVLFSLAVIAASMAAAFGAGVTFYYATKRFNKLMNMI